MICADNYLRYSTAILFCIVGGLCSYGQIPTIFYDKDNTPYGSALSGGFLAPQFSLFDLNGDGSPEMITFDRFSGIVQVWSRTPDQLTYELARDIKVEWPVLQNWVLIRDFDLDGIPDIFTQGYHGIAVYRGFIENTKIRFEKLSGQSFIDDSLIFHNRSGGTTNIYHAASDIPIIEDLDGDGDLDILTFELSGSYLYFYENSHEESGNYLDFVLRHNCWGYFSEDQFSEDINLSDAELSCPPAFSVRHAGSAGCLLDFNHDSLPDLLLGDIGSGTLKVLINHGSHDTSLIKEVVPVFPNKDSPAILQFFPAAYLMDVDEDSVDDIIIAVNGHPSTDQEGLWLYLGTGNSNKPFDLHTQNWLDGEYIDLGQYSSPYFMDVNGDGLDDLLVSYQVTDTSYVPANKIAFFEALDDRVFQLRNEDFLELSGELIGGYRPYLTSGDVDGDGDEDLFVSLSDGSCYLLFNKSGPNKLFDLDRIEKDWGGLKMWSGATAELFDVDSDGDLDVLAGFDNGTIGLYVNTGDAKEAIFDSNPDHAPNINGVGQIRTVGTNTLLGRSAPRIVVDGPDTILISGSHSGEIFAYHMRTDHLDAVFPEADLSTWPGWIGGNGRITVRKVDDQTVQLMVGNIAGGLTEHFIALVPTHTDKPDNAIISVYPNPITPGQALHVRLDATSVSKTLNIYHPTGQLLRSVVLPPGQTQLNTIGWKSGIYFLQMIRADGRVGVHKIIVQ